MAICGETLPGKGNREGRGPEWTVLQGRWQRDRSGDREQKLSPGAPHISLTVTEKGGGMGFWTDPEGRATGTAERALGREQGRKRKAKMTTVNPE